MAFSSRFAFWEQKVKDEDKSLAVKKNGNEDGPPGSPVAEKEAPSLRLQSPEPPTHPRGKGKSPEPLINGEAQPPSSPAVNGLEGPHAEAQPGAPAEDPRGLSRTKVAKAMRHLVHKVLPGEEADALKEPPKRPKGPEPRKKPDKAGPRVLSPPPRMLSPPPRPSPSPKPPPKEAPPKDDLSAGLKSLMSRAKTREHRPHSRQRGRKEGTPPPEKTEKPPPLPEGTSSEAQSPPEDERPSEGSAKRSSQDASPASQEASPPAKPEETPPPSLTAGGGPKEVCVVVQSVAF
ncbi:basic salivary proline-rich protein 1-like [Pseudonaja textilis]|uniref:basic salivary proline-rich protein 1-like n=1 Tax=Pseudonaja textilis TaxID=8673 RepID=UPI000EA93782|nr:basic salivary proline-rich protein 1-like [Pseudonaja textilis]